MVLKPLDKILVNKRLGQYIYLFQHTKKSENPFCFSLLPLVNEDKPEQIFAHCRTSKLSPQTCVEESKFMKLLQKTIANSHDELVYLFESRANLLKNGWLHLVDERSPVIWGRTPEPEDIIGVCRVDEGHVDPSSYQPVDTFRLFTINGCFSLPKSLHKKIIESIQ